MTRDKDLRAEADRHSHELCQWLEYERGMGSDDSVFAEIASRTEAFGLSQRQRGEREGLERAAKMASQRADTWKSMDGECAFSLQEECEDIAHAIRSLLQPEDEGR